MCDALAQGLTRGAFTVCVDGPPDTASARLREGLRELERRAGAYTAGDSVALVGLGPFAPVAAQLAREEPPFFRRVGLVDVGGASWTSTHALIFAERGGQRLALVGAGAESGRLAHAARVTTRAGASARAFPSDQRDAGFRWLFEADPRFGEDPAAQ